VQRKFINPHRASTRTGRPQGIAPTMDGFRFTVVKRLCEYA